MIFKWCSKSICRVCIFPNECNIVTPYSFSYYHRLTESRLLRFIPLIMSRSLSYFLGTGCGWEVAYLRSFMLSIWGLPYSAHTNFSRPALVVCSVFISLPKFEIMSWKSLCFLVSSSGLTFPLFMKADVTSLGQLSDIDASSCVVTAQCNIQPDFRFLFLLTDVIGKYYSYVCVISSSNNMDIGRHTRNIIHMKCHSGVCFLVLAC